VESLAARDAPHLLVPSTEERLFRDVGSDAMSERFRSPGATIYCTVSVAVFMNCVVPLV